MKIRQTEGTFVHMSFREKSAWISVLSMSGIYGFYFWSIGHAERPDGGLHVGGLLSTVIALVVVQTVLTIAVAILDPKQANAPQDERERLIELRATRFAYAVLAGSVAWACFFGAVVPPVHFGANVFLFFVVAAEVLRSGCQIIQFRRGA